MPIQKPKCNGWTDIGTENRENNIHTTPTPTSTHKMAKLKTLLFVKKYLFVIKVSLAHLQYVCNVYVKFLKDPTKVLREVDFTKYALLTITD